MFKKKLLKFSNQIIIFQCNLPIAFIIVVIDEKTNYTMYVTFTIILYACYSEFLY